MQLTAQNAQIHNILQRNFDLYIGNDFAVGQYDKSTEQRREESEQAYRRRSLLEVERESEQHKISAATSKEQYQEQVADGIYRKIENQLHADLNNIDWILNDQLSFNKEVVGIFDTLAVKAASVNKISRHIQSLPWLAEQVVTLINKPQYRKQADVKVTDATIALSYFGLDNLKLVMPTCMMLQWLPESTSPYGLMKRKLWQNSLSVSLAAIALGREEGFDDYTIFATAMLSTLGYMVVTNRFFAAHNLFHQQELQRATEEEDRVLMETLQRMSPSKYQLRDSMFQHGARVSAHIVEKLPFKHLHIAETLSDLAYVHYMDDLSPEARVIAQAQAFVNHESLQKQKLISKAETHAWFDYFEITPEQQSLLESTDIHHLKLNF